MTRKPRPLNVVDLFAGCGGATTGMRRCFGHLGQEIRVTAVNHWDLAVATHETNHPEDDHLCTGVDDVDIESLLAKHGYLDIVWASPTCTFFSRARGGKPYRDQQRSLAECLIDWADIAKPEVMLVENVKEFVEWGPLRQKVRDGKKLWIRIERAPADTSLEVYTAKKRKVSYQVWQQQVLSFAESKARYIETSERPPVRRKKGETEKRYWLRLEKKDWGPALEPDPLHKGKFFRAWRSRIEKRGYITGYGFFRAADYGDTTTRERFFMQAHRKDTGRKVVWPKPTRISRKAAIKQGLDPDAPENKHRIWKSAADHVIDWSIEGKSIFERDKPLSPKTIKRIFEGLKKFGLRAFFTPGQGERAGQTPRTHDTAEPVPVVTAQGHLHIAQPKLIPFFETLAKDPALTPLDPEVRAAYASWRAASPGFLVAMEHGGRALDSKEPIPVISTAKGGAFAAVQPFILPAESGEKRARDTKEPLQVVTVKARGIALVEPAIAPTDALIVNMRGSEKSHLESSAQPAEEPVPVVTAGGNHHGVAQAFLVDVAHGASSKNDDRTRCLKEPLTVVTGSRSTALIQPFILPKKGVMGGDNANQARSVQEPVNAILTDGRVHLCQPMLIPQGGGGIARETSEPTPTVACDGAIAVAQPVLEPKAVIVTSGGPRVSPQSVDEPLGTQLTREHRGVAEPFLIQFYGTGHADSVKDPLAAVTTKGRHGLVRPEVITPDGRRWLLDVKFRMLQPHELKRAHSFPKDYKFQGNKTDHTRMIGNSNPVFLSSAITYSAWTQDENYQEPDEYAH